MSDTSSPSIKVGLSPGSLIYFGEKKVEHVRLSLFAYEKKQYEELMAATLDDVLAYAETPLNLWINVDGLHIVEILGAIGERFNIHPLVLEDILTTDQRPKIENYDNLTFIVLKMFIVSEENHSIESEQISLILGSNFVISFQERPGDVFDHLRHRTRTDGSRIRSHGPDYLLYRLLDTVVDSYFTVLEHFDDRIEDLEDELMEDPEEEHLREIYRLKRELLSLRKSVWPLREILSEAVRGESQLIKKSTRVFLRDAYDHSIQVMDTVDNYREMVSNLFEMYMSSMSQRMNEVMKVLTIIATIFIPLTFIAGIYGMNFNPDAGAWSMPELNWAWGYPASLILMALVSLGLIVFFKRKGWF